MQPGESSVQLRDDFDVALLRGFRVNGLAHDAIHPGGQRLIALLALRGPLDRSIIAGLLWPEFTEAHASGCLRSALCRLNPVGESLLRVTRRHVGLAPGLRVDVAILEDQSRRLRQGCDPQEAIDVFELGVGDLLPGWEADWLALERERLHLLQIVALTALARAFATAGDIDLALLTAHRALMVEPMRESSHRLLVELHIASGDYAEALRRFDQYRSLVETELRLPPSPQMTALVQSIPRTPARRR